MNWTKAANFSGVAALLLGSIAVVLKYAPVPFALIAFEFIVILLL